MFYLGISEVFWTTFFHIWSTTIFKENIFTHLLLKTAIFWENISEKIQFYNLQIVGFETSFFKNDHRI